MARGFGHRYRVLLCDEPTANPDGNYRETALALIKQTKVAGAAIVCIFHNPDVRARVRDHGNHVAAFTPRTVA